MISAGRAAAGWQPRQWRLVWLGAGFLVIALMAFLVGRALRSKPATEAANGAGRRAPAASASSSGAAPAGPAGETPGLEEARGLLRAPRSIRPSPS